MPPCLAQEATSFDPAPRNHLPPKSRKHGDMEIPAACMVQRGFAFVWDEAVRNALFLWGG